MEPGPELAHWLVEAGKRVRRPAGREIAWKLDGRRDAPHSTVPRVLLLGALAVAGFQYIYLDTQLELVLLRSLIVFVFG